MECRWLEPDEIERLVNPCLRVRGMVELNINERNPTCRVAGAFEDGKLVRAFALQLFPVLGPLVETDSTFRDNGEATRSVAEFMVNFIVKEHVRGALTVCDTPLSERLAQRFEMEKVQSPVYVWIGTKDKTPPQVM